MRKLSKQDNELVKRIDEVLHYLWDPIGVRDVPAARDEYDSYVGHVFTMLKGEASNEQISKHLRNIRVVNMCMGQMEDRGSEDEIASVLTDWKETSFDN